VVEGLWGMHERVTVALLTPMTGGFFYGGIIAGAAREVGACGGQVLVVQTLDADLPADGAVGAPDFGSTIGWDHIDGVLSVAAAVQEPFLRQLRAAGKPVVLAANHVEDFDAALVTSDNRGGVRSAVDHLIEHGHTRIGFVGNLEQSDMRERHAAYEAALRGHGLVPHPTWLFETVDNTESGGEAAAALLLADPVRPAAVIVATDRNAIGLMRALADAGLSLPDDLAVVGFDDIEVGSVIEPALSTVNQHFDQVGGLAARLLLGELRGDHVDRGRHTSPSGLVTRSSCGCGHGAPLAGSELRRLAEIDAIMALRPPKEPRDELLQRFRDVLVRDPRPVGIEETVEGLATMFVEAVELAVASGGTFDPTRLGEAADGVRRVDGRPETLQCVVAAVLRYVFRVSAAVPESAAATGVREALARLASQAAAMFWQPQVDHAIQHGVQLEASLRDQVQVGLGLLDHRTNPELLGWLSSTQVRAGCLALWEGGPESGVLRVSGVYDPSGATAPLLDTRVKVKQFPPVELIAQGDPSIGEVTFVIPVKTRDSNWGLLAVVGLIDSTSMMGLESYSHWAALLTVALEQKALQESIRRSEERYSLVANATRDGLWDWDVTAGSMYYSRRAAEMLGDPATTYGEPEVWWDRVHPDDLDGLRAALAGCLRGSRGAIEVEHRLRVGDGPYRWTLCRAVPVRSWPSVGDRIVGSLSDIDARKQLEEVLRRGALYDALTGLPNRTLFTERLERAIAAEHRRSDPHFAVLFLDLDGFKPVNDTLGHLAGDQLLTLIGQRLEGSLRETDTAARFGGDEFAVLLYDTDPAAVSVIVQRIQRVLSAPVELEQGEVTVSASIGIALSTTGYPRAQDMIRDADAAMYVAKARQRGSAELFSPQVTGAAVT